MADEAAAREAECRAWEVARSEHRWRRYSQRDAQLRRRQDAHLPASAPRWRLQNPCAVRAPAPRATGLHSPPTGPTLPAHPTPPEHHPQVAAARARRRARSATPRATSNATKQPTLAHRAAHHEPSPTPACRDHHHGHTHPRPRAIVRFSARCTSFWAADQKRTLLSRASWIVSPTPTSIPRCAVRPSTSHLAGPTSPW